MSNGNDLSNFLLETELVNTVLEVVKNWERRKKRGIKPHELRNILQKVYGIDISPNLTFKLLEAMADEGLLKRCFEYETRRRF